MDDGINSIKLIINFAIMGYPSLISTDEHFLTQKLQFLTMKTWV